MTVHCLPTTSLAWRSSALSGVRVLLGGRVLLGIAAVVLATDLSTAADKGPEKPPSTGRSAPRRVRFNRDIRPILSDKCFQCHGRRRRPSARGNCGWTASEPPRLRQRRAARPSFRATSMRASFIAGSARTDSEEQMPPPKSGKRLTAAEIQRLKTWIEEGAEYEAHWAFIPPVRPELPPVASWTVGPQSDRRICSGPAGERGPFAGCRGRPGDAHPPRQPRPDRAAADNPGG